MRFLFVYHTHARQAEQLLAELQVDDVRLIVATNASEQPTSEELVLLNQHKGASAAACEINRHYRKNVAPLVEFSLEPKKFRIADQQLRDWLVPRSRAAVTIPRPSEAFREAAAKAMRLILAPRALECADDLVEHRWRFAKLAADLLGDYANGEIPGALTSWKSSHGVAFAANGRVTYRYEVNFGSAERHKDSSSWHLKEGDNTTKESAARVYFAPIKCSQGRYVLVFYVGPHPDNGEYVTVIDLA
jgi:hypothetical protein